MAPEQPKQGQPQKKAGPAIGLIVVAGVALQAASPWTMNFLEKWESSGSRVLIAYADKLAGGLPTVCNGLTRHVTTTPIVVGAYWPKEKCVAEEQKAVKAVQVNLARCFKLPPTQRVFDVATSHAWNNGAAATCGSAAMSAWNSGQWELGCRRLARSDSGKPVWSYVCKTAKGQRTCVFVQGLANRREDEASECPKGASQIGQSGA